jgi:hypothetical protein
VLAGGSFSVHLHKCHAQCKAAVLYCFKDAPSCRASLHLIFITEHTSQHLRKHSPTSCRRLMGSMAVRKVSASDPACRSLHSA